MLSLLSSFMLAQVVTAPLPLTEQQFLTQPQEIRSLSGKLNDVPVFNSNSPEIVQMEGILLSTFPQTGKYDPSAHLNKTLNGRFDLFAHHIARPVGDNRTLYQGIIIENPSNRFVTVKVLQAASYLTSPDAPFIDLPQQVEDPLGQVFSGPGSRLMGDMLRGFSQTSFPRQVIIPPQASAMLLSLPINTSNARSTYMRLESDGPVYMANLSMFAVPETPPESDETKDNKITPMIKYRQPSLSEWRSLLVGGRLVSPRDKIPTPIEKIRPNDPKQPIYGRVSGISVGTEWKTKLVDKQTVAYLSIPERGKAFSYPLSTVNVGTQGTRQIQSAPMLARYADTAYLAHGNYGVHYQLALPLRNKTSDKQSVSLTIQTPIKQDQYGDRLFFVSRPTGQVFFRGTVRISYIDDRGQSQNRYFHLTQRQGQMGDPLLTLNLSPGEQRQVILDFLYPPDATPPQVVTVKTEQLFYGSSFRR
jgi:hypothetical protein